MGAPDWTPARVNPDGSPQRDYVYQVPEITDDGWTTAPLVDAGVDPKPIKTFVSQILDGSLENIHGVVVAKDGDLILEEYFYGYDRDKKHMLASVTKSITSLLIGIAIDRNMIGGVDQGLYHFFPEYADPAQETAKREITLAHALTMTAGLQWNEYRPPPRIRGTAIRRCTMCRIRSNTCSARS
jgi:CubicO group peptidase (beta-lactamase class C family)